MNFNICKKALLVLLAVSFFLVGCSSGAPDEAIKQAIINSQPTLKGGGFVLVKYEITNTYTREIEGETYHFYDYNGEISSAFAETHNPIQGSVGLVHRGDSWYF